MKHCGLGQGVPCWLQWRENSTGFNWLAIDVKMDGSVLEEKSSFKIMWLMFSLKLDWGSYIIFIAKTASKNIGALIRSSMKFLSPNVDKLQKWICRTVGPSLATCLEPLAHHWNVARLNLFSRYYFGRCSSELAQLAPCPYS